MNILPSFRSRRAGWVWWGSWGAWAPNWGKRMTMVGLELPSCRCWSADPRRGLMRRRKCAGAVFGEEECGPGELGYSQEGARSAIADTIGDVEAQCGSGGRIA
ncbi:hypothetical protein BU26DRAFT_349416 [Trematosphaeria pertusa]|uniref:Uncharacterized protein n=1 Tax=Trematosphaeria pertusa TaxID=390896 RepID=A0A6A6IDB3_9PLEO|nr:uncharacterized protein BU26DRAFT_349416 [Trematosphaeria pertusa]KAF2247550.1 hypothetical protein BU26DRAFT_349416 [Trematosphaeria pertusa]